MQRQISGAPAKRRRTTLLLPVLLLCAMTLGGEAWASEDSFLDAIKAETQPYDNVPLPGQQMVVSPTVLAEEGKRPFRVLARKQEIARYPCTSCHTDKPVLVKNAATLTHGDVVLNHGRQDDGLSCIDCHHGEQREFLEDKEGHKIDFDHSYRLCGECHFRQKRDWVGGAHGKRVANWAGERVVYNCTSCHDPHSPRFAKRFPATYARPLD